MASFLGSQSSRTRRRPPYALRLFLAVTRASTILSKKLVEEPLGILTGCAWIAWIGASRSARMMMKTTGVTTTQLTDAGTWYAGFATAVLLGITARWDGQIEEAGPEALKK